MGRETTQRRTNLQTACTTKSPTHFFRLTLLLTSLATTAIAHADDGSDLEALFATPPDEAKPIMIWEWMDGVVSAEGITAD